MVKRKATQETNRRAREKCDHWIIVHEPWFIEQKRHQASLRNKDLQEIATWLCILFRCPWGGVHTIQHQTRINSVIAKLSLSIDLDSKLGQYNWSDFLQSPTAYEQQKYSQILEYNYAQYGDQSEKQWKEFYPSPFLPPERFPVIPTPPGPVWCEQLIAHKCPPSWSILLPLPLPPPLPLPHTQLQDSESSIDSKLQLCSVLTYGDSTQFLFVENPFGVYWAPKTLLPDVSDTWYWLQQFVEDITTLYVDPSNRDRIVLRLPAHINLHGILGRHLWRGMLENCPAQWDNEVSIVVRCGEEELHGLIRIDRPASDFKMEQGIFRACYPPPLPFMHEHEELKVKVEDDIKPSLDKNTWPDAGPSRIQVKLEEDQIDLTVKDEPLDIKVSDSFEGTPRKRMKREM